MNISFEKSQLRKELLAKRAEISYDKRARISHEICENVLSSEAFRRADLLLTFVSMSNEVDTAQIIERAFLQNKHVCIPYCVPNKKTMEFYEINSLTLLVKSKFGVLEPNPSYHKLITNFENSLCIVPALSFDKRGNRLGYGGGYYDRFLKKYDGDTMGLCPAEFLQELLPVLDFDIPVSHIVTENGVLQTIDNCS